MTSAQDIADNYLKYDGFDSAIRFSAQSGSAAKVTLTNLDEQPELRLPLCVVFNGPPGSGKDTIAEGMSGVLEAVGVETKLMKFSAPMKAAMAAVFGVEYERGCSLGPLPQRSAVGTPKHLSGRQWLIDFSEKFMKPAMGVDVWARLAECAVRNEMAQRAGPPPVFVFTDGGFPVEPARMTQIFDTVVIFRVAREGYDYTVDSRVYIERADVIGHAAARENAEVRVGEISNNSLSGVAALEAAWVARRWLIKSTERCHILAMQKEGLGDDAPLITGGEGGEGAAIKASRGF